MIIFLWLFSLIQTVCPKLLLTQHILLDTVMEHNGSQTCNKKFLLCLQLYCKYKLALKEASSLSLFVCVSGDPAHLLNFLTGMSNTWNSSLITVNTFSE